MAEAQRQVKSCRCVDRRKELQMAKIKTSGFVPADDPMFHQDAYLVGVNKIRTSTSDSKEVTDVEAKTPSTIGQEEPKKESRMQVHAPEFD